MSFIDDIKKKQKEFENHPLPNEELDAAAKKVKDYITKLTDDPYNYSVTEVTLNYEAINDGKGTCKFWIDDDNKHILFTMTVPQFHALMDILSNEGLRRSGEYGPRDGHCHLRW